jgi:hypothetical protein
MLISAILILPQCAAAVQMTSPASNVATMAPEETTVNLFLGAKRRSNYSFEASVIAVGEMATAFEVVCKSGLLNLPGFPTTTCDTNDPVSAARGRQGTKDGLLTRMEPKQPWTVTNGRSTMAGILSTSIASVEAVLDEKCNIMQRSSANCNYTYVGVSNGSTTSTAYTTIITGSLYYEYPVIITAGAEKLSADVETRVSGSLVPVASTSTSGVAETSRVLRISMIKVAAISMAVMTFMGGLGP